MRRLITPDRIANEIRMLQTRYRGCFLLVEGPTDAKVFYSFIDSDTCKIKITYGKQIALKAMAILDANNVEGVLAVLDADFMIAEGLPQSQGNIILTDSHDLETVLLSSDAFGKVLADLLPAEQLELAYRLENKARNSILALGLKIGCVRWLNESQALEFDFKDLPYARFVDPAHEAVNIFALLTILRSTAQAPPSLSNEELSTEIEKLENQTHDPWQVCQGHELIHLLELVLPAHIEKIAGRDTARSVGAKIRPEVLEHNLRLAFGDAELQSTSLFSLVSDWQRSNSPHLVFAA